MARVLILGGGFAGVVAAESLAKRLGHEHQIVLVSRSNEFLFYPALVRLAFGRGEPDNVSFDLREAMLDRRISFVEGEVARVKPDLRQVKISRGEFAGDMHYDFVIFALGRRLATERIAGFFEHAHHLLTIDAALKFRRALQSFHQGHVVLGYCPGARLPVPLFETAFALSHLFKERGEDDRTSVTVVCNETPEEMFGDAKVSQTLRDALKSRAIEFVPDFAINRVMPTSVVSSDGRAIDCDLAMLIPPFTGPGALIATGITDAEGYVRVESTMRVPNTERMYAVGDCVSFPGPKIGHMAVRQAEVAAENLAQEIHGRALSAMYDHELMLVIETEDQNAIFLRKDLWADEPASVSQGRFWSWAKRRHEQFWKMRHA